MRIDGQLINAGTEVVSTLPTTNLFYGRKVLLSTDDTIYQYVNSNWEAVGADAGASTFIELTDTPASYAGAQGLEVAVNGTGDGLTFRNRQFLDGTDTPNDYAGQEGALLTVGFNEVEFQQPSDWLFFTDLADTPTTYNGQADKIVAVNSGETGLEFIDAPSGGGSSTFTGLTDTPADYVGQGDRFVRVKTDESGLEFITGTGGGVATFTDLSDTPNTYAGDANKTVRVKADETGLEFVTGGGGGGVIPATAVGQTIRSTGTGADEYEWTSQLRYQSGDYYMGPNIDLFITDGSLDVSSGLTVQSGGADITGDLTVVADFNISLEALDTISLTGNTDITGDLTVSGTINGNGGGGNGIPTPSEQGLFFRSTGSNAGDYEWVPKNLISWTTGNDIRIGDFDTLNNTDVFHIGGYEIEGDIFQLIGQTDLDFLSVVGDVNFDGSTFNCGAEAFFFGSTFDVSTDPAFFIGDVNIGNNCDALSYTQGGVPLGFVIEEQIIEDINSKYEDKYNESITLNSSSDATNILMAYSDLVPGNSYKVNAHLTLKWTANTTGTPNLKYKVKVQDAATEFRKVEHEQIKSFGEITTQSWSFTFSFQAAEPTLSLIVDTDVDNEDIVAGVALGVGMTVEEFETDVRVETTEW